MTDDKDKTARGSWSVRPRNGSDFTRQIVSSVVVASVLAIASAFVSVQIVSSQVARHEKDLGSLLAETGELEHRTTRLEAQQAAFMQQNDERHAEIKDTLRSIRQDVRTLLSRRSGSSRR